MGWNSEWHMGKLKGKHIILFNLWVSYIGVHCLVILATWNKCSIYSITIRTTKNLTQNSRSLWKNCLSSGTRSPMTDTISRSVDQSSPKLPFLLFFSYIHYISKWVSLLMISYICVLPHYLHRHSCQSHHLMLGQVQELPTWKPIQWLPPQPTRSSVLSVSSPPVPWMGSSYCLKVSACGRLVQTAHCSCFKFSPTAPPQLKCYFLKGSTVQLQG